MTKKIFKTICGTVLSGQKLGKEIGVQTANLLPHLAKNIPKGLYECDVVWQKQTFLGLLYYGYNSLSQKDCLEVHILNFNKNIYNETITVELKKFVRPEIKFKNIEELKQQIKKDLECFKQKPR